MNRLCLTSSIVAIAAALAPQIANAEPNPGVLYIPTEEVTLNVVGVEPCSGVGNENSAFGCLPGITESAARAPYADLGTIQPQIETALTPYNVYITNERPPEYVPYAMLLMSDEPSKESESYTCSRAPISCSGLKRNAIGLTNGGTLNCTDPDPLRTALYAIGRMSGLEGKEDNDDPMDFPPDFTVPTTDYLDACDPFVPQLGKKGVELPAECTSLDHVGECAENQINSHADMLNAYGERTEEDTDPPVIEIIMPPADSLEVGMPIALSATITDADPIVAVRWTMVSDALIEVLDGEDTFTKCTNEVCDLEFAAFTPTDDAWAFNDVIAPGGGTYTITLEASDFHGNVADPVMVVLEVAEAPGGDAGTGTGGGDADGGGTVDGGDGVFTTGVSDGGEDTGGTGDGGGTAGQDDDDSGCSCTTGGSGPGGAALMLLGLVGLGVSRRRAAG